MTPLYLITTKDLLIGNNSLDNTSNFLISNASIEHLISSTRFDGSIIAQKSNMVRLYDTIYLTFVAWFDLGY